MQTAWHCSSKTCAPLATSISLLCHPPDVTPVPWNPLFSPTCRPHHYRTQQASAQRACGHREQMLHSSGDLPPGDEENKREVWCDRDCKAK
ncbi:uncharacterized [Tachysurus ichikawai]